VGDSNGQSKSGYHLNLRDEQIRALLPLRKAVR
jgi:hypothetical protein